MKTKKHLALLLLFALITSFTACRQQDETQLSVLQLNLWHQTKAVPGGEQGLIDIIDQTNPDVVLLCELVKDDKDFIVRITSELEKKGKVYHSDGHALGVGILSKYNFDHTSAFYPNDEDGRPIVKATITVNNHPIVLYSAHLDYRHYECYLPRGYSGATWQKIDNPVTNTDTILALNRVSMRDESIEYFIAEARQEVESGNLVLIGGDFNEPSHLDWQEDTKNLFDHNGAVVLWDCSVMLYNAGYLDSFREKHPNAAKMPAFTFPAGNKRAELKDLSWAPDVDERDRIDFIYYMPNPVWSVSEASIVGSAESVYYGQIRENDTQDTFIEPQGIWPSDHKGNLTVFRIR